MATIDDKVVAMSFESGKFESGVGNAISALDKLKAALHFPDAGKGLDDINKSASRVDLSHIARGVDDIKGRLSSLALTAVAVFANIASKAIAAGASLVKSISISPILDGLHEYETQINAVQVIMGNTAAAGVKLDDVNKALDQLNTYADKTIYNFGQMTKNVGTFTAAGVDLKTSVAAIKGIANMAALSGSSAEQASNAMYQLSQAISSGKVSLMDWKSVENASMGSATFKRALAETAVHMGTLKDNAVKMIGPMKNIKINGESFRQSISSAPGKDSWLTSDVLTTTLKQLSGDMTDAQLAAQGYTKAQIKGIQSMAKTALDAAVTVKTFSQLVSTTKEQLGTGWASTFEIIFGDFAQAKVLFTGISQAIGNFVSASANARNKVLQSWKDLGGRTMLIESVKTAFHNLGLAIAPIKEAFRDIFPPVTGRDLLDLTKKFQDFANALKPSKETVDNLKRTFRGLFAIMDIGKQIISGIFTVFGHLFGALHGGSGGFLELTGNIGDWLVKLDEALKKGKVFQNFFDNLGSILEKPIKLLGDLSGAIAGLFSGVDSGGISGQMSGLASVLDTVGQAWDNFVNRLKSGQNILKPVFDAIVQGISSVSPAIGQALANMNFETVFAAIRTGLFAGLVLLFKNFFGKGTFVNQISQGLSGFSGGILGNISGSFKALQGSMVAMQNNVKADTLQKIAIAIAALTASVVALSFVDPKRLQSALAGIAVGMGELLGAMAIMDKIGKSGGFIKMPFITAAMISFAFAIDILSIAVIALSKLSWEELLKGLAGVGGLLAGLAVAVKPLSAGSKGMITAGFGLMEIAVAMKILASAMKDFGGMAWGEIVKGLAGVGGGLLIFTKTVSKLPAKGMAAQGIGIIAIAAGMKILASAIQDFGGMNWGTIGKGLAAVGGALLVIGVGMRAMPGNMLVLGGGLVLVAFGLQKIVDSIATMGGMSIGTLAKGIISLSIALDALGASLIIMSEGIGGAVALGIAAAGLALLVPVIVSLGQQSWGDIFKGMASLALALTLIGIAGLALTPIIPELVALGAALLLIGGGFALAGAGVALIGVGLSAIAASGSAAIAILIGALESLAQKIPEIAKQTILGMLEVANALADTAPKFVDAMVKILDSLVEAVIRIVPKLVQAMQVLFNAMVTFLHNNESKFIQAGFDLLMALLNGIKNNIGQIVTSVVGIVTKFEAALQTNLNKIITAGLHLLTSLLKGIGDNLNLIVNTVTDIITKIVTSVAGQYTKLIKAGLDALGQFLEGIANGLPKVIAAATDIIVNLITGIGNAGNRIVKAAVDVMIKFIHTIAAESVKLADEGMKAIVFFLNGVAAAIDANSGDIRQAGVRVGVALINGMTGGLASAATGLYNKISGIMSKAKSMMSHPWEILSPSKVTEEMGMYIIQGLTKGLDDNAKDAYSSAVGVSETVIDGFNETLQTASPSKVMIQIGQFVGQGFAQGLRGSGDDVKNAFAELNTKLSDAMSGARETIASETKKLTDTQKEEADKIREINKKKYKDESDRVAAIKEVHKQYADTIKESEAVIAQNEATLHTAHAAHIVLVKNLKDERIELTKKANEFAVVHEKLKQARQDMLNLQKSLKEQYGAAPEISDTMVSEIADARQRIADANTQLSEAITAAATAETPDPQAITNAQAAVVDAQKQFDDLVAGKVLNAEGTAVDQLATYVQALKTQTDTVSAYQATLQQLRKLGLDDATYQKLLNEGPADQRFAEQLLSGGQQAVGELNKLDTNLSTTADRLATNAGNNLFKVGQKGKEGLITGLESDEADLLKRMGILGKKILKAIKKSLGIKSPSTEFAEVGKFAMQGLALGFEANTKVVTDSLDNMAKDALTKTQQIMSDISAAVGVDTNPTITPILDLSIIRAQSQDLNNLTNVVPITASSSYQQAASISSMQNVSLDENATPIAGTSIKFEQNNYSPESLSEVEIYRQTKNQISQLKSVLAF